MNSSMVICAGVGGVGAALAAWRAVGVVSLWLVAGESLYRSRSWLLVVLIQYAGRDWDLCMF